MLTLKKPVVVQKWSERGAEPLAESNGAVVQKAMRIPSLPARMMDRRFMIGGYSPEFKRSRDAEFESCDNEASEFQILGRRLAVTKCNERFGSGEAFLMRAASGTLSY
jgi:hypothetical protein